MSFKTMNGPQSSAFPTISLSNCMPTSQWCYGLCVQPPNHQRHSRTAPEYFLYHTVTILIQQELISRCPAPQILVFETLTLKGLALKRLPTLQPNELFIDISITISHSRCSNIPVFVSFVGLANPWEWDPHELEMISLFYTLEWLV